MNMSFDRGRLTIVGGLLLAGTILAADGTRFSVFEPLLGSAGATSDESTPITLGNPAFFQESIINRQAQLATFSRTAAAMT